MKNGNQPINPIECLQSDGNIGLSIGLTKREYFAAMAMQGYIAAGSQGMPSPENIAKYSIETADALLSELSKPESK